MKYLLVVCLLVSSSFVVKKRVYVLDRLTVYAPISSQTDSSPLVTACGARIDTVKLRRGELRWLALSRDFLVRWGGSIKYGDRVRIYANDPEIDGVYYVKDCMNKRYKKSGDILSYRKGGKWQNVKMTKL